DMDSAVKDTLAAGLLAPPYLFFAGFLADHTVAPSIAAHPIYDLGALAAAGVTAAATMWRVQRSPHRSVSKAARRAARAIWRTRTLYRGIKGYSPLRERPSDETLRHAKEIFEILNAHGSEIWVEGERDYFLAKVLRQAQSPESRERPPLLIAATWFKKATADF